MQKPPKCHSVLFPFSSGVLTFSYRYDAGNLLNLPVASQANYCDGKVHKVFITRFGIKFNITVGNRTILHTGLIRKAEFSKPDKIKLGGEPGSKFDGCLYDVMITINNKIIYPLYEVEDVEKADVIYGACVSVKSGLFKHKH